MTRKEYISQDIRMGYCRPWSKEWFLDWLLQSEQYQIKKFVKALRSEEYYTSVRPCKRRRLRWVRRKNIQGAKLGFFIPAGCFGPDLKIWHYGSIIVNPESRIGSGCDIHGNCCIGSNGKTQDSPVIGNNVNLGQYCQVIGGIAIADDVKVGAGAVVTKNVETEGATVVGVPAHII